VAIEKPLTGEWKDIKRKIDEEAAKERIGNAKPPHFEMYTSLARLPLTISRFVLLTTLLPDLDLHLAKKALGLDGDKQPYWHNPPAEVKERLRGVVVLDPFAGGGSIPLEAARLGAHAVALEYNPVQWLALKTIQLARERGKELIDPRAWETLKKRYRRGFGADMEAICKNGEAEKAGPLAREGCRIALELEKELSRYYPPRNGRRVSHYIWAKQVRCPKCGAWVPLVLDSGLDADEKIYWKLVYNGDDYDVVIEKGGEGIKTISEGKARCPKCSAPISNEYIRENIGHNDKMVVVMTEDKKFHPAIETDRKAYEEVPEPERLTELIAPNDPRAITPPLYGYKTFGELFNKRQHYYLNKLVEKLKQIEPSLRTVLAWLVAKQADYNSRLTSWHKHYLVVTHTFENKVIAMSWDYVEVNPFAKGSGTLWGALFDVLDGFAFLVHALEGAGPFEPVFGSALNLPFADRSIKYVVTDPPYFDNIPYPESYDYVYVWLKRVVGDLYPEAFSFWTLWRDRSAEDISVGGGRTEEHFKTLLKRAFKEVRRVITDDGVFVVYFAHSRREAWAATLEALMEAGFAVSNIIPVKAQSATDVQARGKVSMVSALVLVLRPRLRDEVEYVERLKPRLEAEVRRAVEELWREGYRGVDLMMAAYATALKHATQVGVLKSMRGNAVENVVEFAERVAVSAAVEAAFGGTVPDKLTGFYIYAANNSGNGLDSDTYLLLTKLFVSREELIRRRAVRETKSGSKKKAELLDWKDRCDVVKNESPYLVDVLHRLLCAFNEDGVRGVKRLLEQGSFTYTLSDICRALHAIYVARGDEVVKNFDAAFCRKSLNEGPLFSYGA
jgi:adenine-specific DNA methylase